MDAGKLSCRVMIQAPSTDEDGSGGRVNAWVDVGEVWARIQPLKGSALWQANQIDEKVNVRITIWHREDVRPGYRIVHGTAVYRVSAVLDPAMNREVLEITCETLRDEFLQGIITKPAISEPVSGELEFFTRGTFTSSDFADADTHTSSRWQVAAEADASFATPIVDITSATDLTALTMQVGKLLIETAYRVRVRYTGKKFATSPWSDAVVFTTSDER